MRYPITALGGVILLDKPIGISSFQAIHAFRKLFGVKKAGHTGTLDPLASGVLPCCFGEATKFSHYLLEADKVYTVSARLGVRTSTGDAEGEVLVTREVPAFTQSDLRAILQRLQGEKYQAAPRYSALKYQGKPLYYYARQGIEVPQKVRAVCIHDCQLLSAEGEQLTLAVRCSKGTYIRTLIEELGEQLGCGAYVSMLRRQACGNYCLSQSHTLSNLTSRLVGSTPEHTAEILSAHALSIPQMLDHLPELFLPVDLSQAVSRGRPVPWVPNFPPGEYRLYLAEGPRFLGIGRYELGWVRPVRLLHERFLP